jgi:hypothetical protein
MTFFGFDIIKALWDDYPKWIFILHILIMTGSFYLLTDIFSQNLNILHSMILKAVSIDRLVKRLKRIQNVSYGFSIINVFNLPGMYIFADQEDAPGILIFMIVLIGIGIAIGIIFGILKRYFLDIQDKTLKK